MAVECTAVVAAAWAAAGFVVGWPVWGAARAGVEVPGQDDQAAAATSSPSRNHQPGRSAGQPPLFAGGR